MTRSYDRTENGNVALTGEIDLASTNGSFLLAIGFGTNPAEAGQRALSSLYQDYHRTREDYIEHWRSWLKRYIPPEMNRKTGAPFIDGVQLEETPVGVFFV